MAVPAVAKTIIPEKGNPKKETSPGNAKIIHFTPPVIRGGALDTTFRTVEAGPTTKPVKGMHVLPIAKERQSQAAFSLTSVMKSLASLTTVAAETGINCFATIGACTVLTSKFPNAMFSQDLVNQAALYGAAFLSVLSFGSYRVRDASSKDNDPLRDGCSGCLLSPIIFGGLGIFGWGVGIACNKMLGVSWIDSFLASGAIGMNIAHAFGYLIGAPFSAMRKGLE